MADSRLDRLRRAPVPPALIALLGILGVQPASGAESAGDIVVDAAGLQIDHEANTLRLPRVQIRQGAMLIRADEARARGVEVDFANTEWEFRGSVHIEFEGGELDANEATAKFAANRLQNARVSGSPATFSHQLKGAAQRNRGRADTIEYDVALAQLRLAGSAWYTDGRNEFATEALVYSLTERSAETVPGHRVQITIRPQEGAATPEATREPPAP